MSLQAPNLGARECDKLQVVTWLWGVGTGPFTSEDVNKLYRAMRRHYHKPFTFWCITDFDTKERVSFENGVYTYPMSEFRDHSEMRAGQRGCFHRLRLLDRSMGDVFGPRILQMDLDAVVVGDVTPLFTRAEPVVIHVQNDAPGRATRNPSLLLMDAGALHPVWERFHAAPHETWQAAKNHGWNCSDMSVINDYLHQNRATVKPATWETGVARYWKDIKPTGLLPADARIVLFYGNDKATDPAVQARSPWIAEHLR